MDKRYLTKILIASAAFLIIFIVLAVTSLSITLNKDSRERDEYRKTIENWLVRNVQNEVCYQFNLSIISSFSTTNTAEKTKSITRKYKFTINRPKKIIKIDLVGDSIFNPIFAKRAFGNDLNKAFYITISDQEFIVYMPVDNGYKKYIYRDSNLSEAFSRILLPENISIPKDLIIADGKTSSRDFRTFLNVQIVMDSDTFYLPFYLFAGVEPQKKSNLSISYNYFVEDDQLTNVMISDVDSHTLSILHTAYQLVTGENYSKTYVGMDLTQEFIAIDNFQKAQVFGLPSVS